MYQDSDVGRVRRADQEPQAVRRVCCAQEPEIAIRRRVTLRQADSDAYLVSTHETMTTMDLDWLLGCVSSQHYRYSRHGDRERQNDELTLLEVEQAMLSGRIT
jgi:hypothetical protein